MTHIRFFRFLALAALAVLMLVPATATAGVGIGFGFYGPVYPWGYWGPGPYAYPYGYPYGPYPGYGYPAGYPPRPMGELRIKSPDSHAQIYVNGKLIGRAQELKRMYLKPGTYDIEQHIGDDVQTQRVYVVAYRSVKVEFGKPGTPSPKPGPPPAEWSPEPQPLPAPAPLPAPEAPAEP